MKRPGMFLMIVLAVFGLFASDEGHAATYRYTDKDGNIGLADDLGAIPEQYRASAVLISGIAHESAETTETTAAPPASFQQNEAGDQQAAPAAVPAPAVKQPAQEVQRMPFSIRLAISIGVVVAAILVSVFLGKISAMHGHDRAIHILRVSLSGLVVLYLLAAHAKDVMTIAKMAGSHVQSVSEESAKKGEKAAEAIKALDSAIKNAEMQVNEAGKAIHDAEQASEQ